MKNLHHYAVGDAPGGSMADHGRKALFTVSTNRVAAQLFSDRNLQRLDLMLRRVIREKYGHVVSRQSVDELAIVLRAVYEMYGNPASEHPELEVEKLNAYALEYLVPHVKGNIDAYISYVRDSTTPYRLLDRPTNTSLRGQNVAWNHLMD
jgi:hypothetical protein